MTMADGPSAWSRTGRSASSEIRIANRISEMERVAELVDSFGADHELSNEVVVALNVSLDEILNNIISYGYDDTGDHDIVVGAVTAVGSGGGEPLVHWERGYWGLSRA